MPALRSASRRRTWPSMWLSTSPPGMPPGHPGDLLVEPGVDSTRHVVLRRRQWSYPPIGPSESAAAAALEGHGDWEFYAYNADGSGMRFRARRVVFKARVVKLKGVESQAIAAHLRYLQREGVTIDARRGLLYSAVEDEADPKGFAERGSQDRHQFRFIVAAEDGVALGSSEALHAPVDATDGARPGHCSRLGGRRSL